MRDWEEINRQIYRGGGGGGGAVRREITKIDIDEDHIKGRLGQYDGD